MTFTPLWGMTELAKEFIQAEDASPKKLITATWDDAPHLSAEAKAELYKSIPPHEREARTEGRPMLGSGAVYPVAESDIVVDDFAIPDYFPRAYGMDVGWSKTAACWGALDRDNDVAYITGEHYRGQAEPVTPRPSKRAVIGSPDSSIPRRMVEASWIAKPQPAKGHESRPPTVGIWS